MHIGQLIAKQSSPFVSLEFFPPKDEGTLADFYQVVEKLQSLSPLFVSVTYGAGGTNQDNTLKVTAKLASMGLNIMAHLTCVGSSNERIAKFLQDLLSVGVDNVLALRGDAPKDKEMPPSKFKYASDLIAFIRQEESQMGIGCACYPTPHPESLTYEIDRKYAHHKLILADFAITQLFFDVREYLALVSDLKKMGINKPIIPGIITLQSFGALKRILSLSGANIPGKLYLSLEEANEKGGAAAVREAGIRFAAEQIRRLLDNDAPGVHLYTLNRADICLELMDRVGLKS
ncbi:MAG: methylenetetrahydrofolate reductase [Desulfovibrionaceae bacterium]|nr:methylenetetrahydrofolate reductase [Desulfovibrionaceae bacterium]